MVLFSLIIYKLPLRRVFCYEHSIFYTSQSLKRLNSGLPDATEDNMFVLRTDQDIKSP